MLTAVVGVSGYLILNFTRILTGNVPYSLLLPFISLSKQGINQKGDSPMFLLGHNHSVAPSPCRCC